MQPDKSYCFHKLVSAWSFFWNSDLVGYYDNGRHPAGKCSNRSQQTPTCECWAVLLNVLLQSVFTRHKKDPRGKHLGITVLTFLYQKYKNCILLIKLPVEQPYPSPVLEYNTHTGGWPPFLWNTKEGNCDAFALSSSHPEINYGIVQRLIVSD